MKPKKAETRKVLWYWWCYLLLVSIRISLSVRFPIVTHLSIAAIFGIIFLPPWCRFTGFQVTVGGFRSQSIDFDRFLFIHKQHDPKFPSFHIYFMGMGEGGSDHRASLLFRGELTSQGKKPSGSYILDIFSLPGTQPGAMLSVRRRPSICRTTVTVYSGQRWTHLVRMSCSVLNTTCAHIMRHVPHFGANIS